MAGSQSERISHVALEGQANFRDLGGYQTSDGRTVKWRQLYRSGRLANLSDMDVDLLEGLGIRTVVNLLTADDVESYALMASTAPEPALQSCFPCWACPGKA